MSDLETVKGIGDKTLLLLNKLNIYNKNDLVNYYPYHFDILTKTNDTFLDGKITIDGIVETLPSVYRFRNNMNKMQFTINTCNRLVKVVIFNRAFLSNNLSIGINVIIDGKYDKLNNTIIASNILINESLDKDKIIPIYSTTSNLKRKTLHTLINNALINYKGKDLIPSYIVDKYNFINKDLSLNIIHNPSDITLLKKSLLRLKYEELFIFMIKISMLKNNNLNYNYGYNRNISIDKVNSFKNTLPYKLTIDQENALNDILSDLNSDKRMNRLLLGDVGSGKTIVAFLSIYAMVCSNYQCALMAPTEILATQHYKNASLLFPNMRIALLTGSLTKKKKEELNIKIKNHEIDLVIGTHALITDNVKYDNLGLVITDEQHRFGVNQRSSLQNKGIVPDILYMSATPIPRTYALTIFKDMDISCIKVLPSGRKEVKTILKDNDEIKDILIMIKKELDSNHQVYVVAPLIEDENNDSVTKLLKNYSTAFKNYKVGMLHGKMKQKDKDEVMLKFINKEIDILISTTVIEVGVDVPNATMIVIHNACSFGLSTLHQLRGRVGRNSLNSYCVLIGNKNNERLKIMEQNSDGFKISEEDFKMRGSGDLFGTKQSGDMIFKIADIKKDFKILEKVSEDVDEFMNKIDNYPYIKQEIDIQMDIVG